MCRSHCATVPLQCSLRSITSALRGSALMDWFGDVVHAARLVPLDTLPLRPLLALCRCVLKGYKILYADGLICKILSDDLSGNIAKVEQALAEMEQLAAVERGAASAASAATAASSSGGGGDGGAHAAAGSGGAGGGGAGGAGSETVTGAAPAAAAPTPLPSPAHSDASSQRSSASSPGLGYAPAIGPYLSDLAEWAPRPAASGVYGARWIVRVLRFVALLLTQLGSEPDLSISLAGRKTYTAIIAPFHAPVMGFVVKCVLYWAPRRTWVLQHPLHGASNADACAACLRVAAALDPLAQACHAILEARGLNFHDVISAVPGGL